MVVDQSSCFLEYSLQARYAEASCYLWHLVTCGIQKTLGCKNLLLKLEKGVLGMTTGVNICVNLLKMSLQSLYYLTNFISHLLLWHIVGQYFDLFLDICFPVCITLVKR